MKRSAKKLVLQALPAQWRNRLIARNRQPMFDAMRKTGLLYVHVPRTGGTSISDHVFDFWIDHFTLREQLATMPADVAALPRFAVVRNPWDRLLSVYSMVRAGSSQDHRIHVFNPAQYDVPGLETFERFVLEWLPERDLRREDRLFHVQSWFLTDEAGVMPFDHLGRCEDMDATQDWLTRELGRPIHLPHYNRSRHAPYRESYTPEMRDTVARIYAEDVALLGYEF